MNGYVFRNTTLWLRRCSPVSQCRKISIPSWSINNVRSCSNVVTRLATVIGWPRSLAARFGTFFVRVIGLFSWKTRLSNLFQGFGKYVQFGVRRDDRFFDLAYCKMSKVLIDQVWKSLTIYYVNSIDRNVENMLVPTIYKIRNCQINSKHVLSYNSKRIHYRSTFQINKIFNENLQKPSYRQP